MTVAATSAFGQPAATFQGHSTAVNALAVSPSGKLIATAGEDGVCFVLDAATLKEAARLGPHGKPQLGVAFVNETEIATSTRLDRDARASVFFWDHTTEKLLRKLPDSEHDSWRLAVSPDGAKLVVRLGDNATRLYFLKKGGRIGIPPPGEVTCHDVAFSTTSDTLSVCNGGTIHHFDLSQPQVRLGGQSAPLDAADATVVLWLKDGHFLSGHSNGRVRIRRPAAARALADFEAHQGAITALAVSPDGKVLATAGKDRLIRAWSLKDGKQAAQFRGHEGEITGLVFAGNKAVVSSSSDKKVKRWLVDDKAEPAPTVDTPAAGETALAKAIQLRRSGRLDEAIDAFTKLVEQAPKQGSGDDGHSRLDVLRHLAEAKRAAGKYDEAARLYLECFQASEPTITRTDKSAPQDLAELARTHSSRGNDAAAIKGLKAVVDRRAKKLGHRHVAVADCHFALGATYTTRRQWLEAIDHLERCLDIRRDQLGDEDDALIRPLLLLGQCYFEAHQSHMAEPALKEALSICVLRYGEADARSLEAECTLGRFYADTGRPDEGGRLLFGSHRKLAALGGDDSESSLLIRRDYAFGLQVVGQLEQSRAEGLALLGNASRYFGPHDFRLTEILSSLAFVNAKLGRVDEAQQYYSQMKDLYVRRFGPDAWQSAMAYASSAIAHYARRDYEQAEREYLRAIELFESRPTGPPTNAHATYNNLASLYRDQQKWEQCAEYFGRSARCSRANLFAQIPVLPDETKFVYATVVMASMRRPFSDSVYHRRQQVLVDASAEWIVNLKGFVVETLAQRAAVSRKQRDPKLRKLVFELAAVRQKLAAASVSLLQQRQNAEQIDALRQREQELAAELGAKTRRDLQSDRWITLRELRESLDEDEVIVEFLNFYYAPVARGVAPSNQYVAWVIPPAGKGNVRLELIGKTEEIDAAVEQYHRDIERSWRIISVADEAAAERQMSRTTEFLSRVLIERVPNLNSFKRWRISPDGALWMVPWAALKTSDKKYAVESHEISYLVSSRQLLWKTTPAQVQKRSVIFANPDYNAGINDDVARGIFSPLPGTAEEAKVILPLMRRYTRTDPVVVRGAAASEKLMKQVRSPLVLLLSTHGYFDKLDPDESAENPLLRCGLAFASANGSMLSQDALGNDGVLTGLEVTNLDLRGTRLVVLSACQTALGDSHRGEGVSGLRQAFQLAGAKTVVATQWSIPDAETVDVTGQMFAALATGKSDAAALQAAQQAVIAKRREQHEAAHPLFWAAFCVTQTGK